MVNSDPYSIIEQVMHGTLDASLKRHVARSCLDKVQFVVVLAYGCRRCQIMPRSQFVSLQTNDVLGMYSQSIPVPSVADWLCRELQEPFGEYVDVVTLAIAYFSLLDNRRSVNNKVISPSLVRSDLLRYSLFYYLLRVDINMDRWATIHVRETGSTREVFVYDQVLKYVVKLSKYEGGVDLHGDDIAPTDLFLESFYPMITVVSSFVLSDLKTALNIESI
jgi:hypothetical protein